MGLLLLLLPTGRLFRLLLSDLRNTVLRHLMTQLRHKIIRRLDHSRRLSLALLL